VSSGHWKFKSTHLIRALKAAKKSGFPVTKAVINAAGEIVLVFGNEANDNDTTPNPWDVVNDTNKKRVA
jgi:hypothetical protein